MELEFGFKPLIPTKTLHKRVDCWNKNQNNPINFYVGDLLNHDS